MAKQYILFFKTLNSFDFFEAIQSSYSSSLVEIASEIPSVIQGLLIRFLLETLSFSNLQLESIACVKMLHM